ncbi:MAG: SAM-dependent methyltransferase [Gammaproteobacteria bacterium]|nr:SAM-dependent methyltransferase [Gammaproteobacteria bacterium]
MTGPLLTLKEHTQLTKAARAGVSSVECSLDLGRTMVTVQLDPEGWQWEGRRYPYLVRCKERTIYFWDGAGFAPVARYTDALIKLVPTEWGPPTFEIDGIKMLPTAQLSPYEDAERKVAWIEPRGKVVLDTCGGLGYFAACCVRGGAERIYSFEKNPEVLWLRSLNPWSPVAEGALTLEYGDITERIMGLASASFDAILHDPPRVGIAGELYSQAFYDQLARVIRRNGRLFHYTGSPNRLTSGRDVPQEVAKRLRKAGFNAEPHGDGVRAIKT